MPLNLEDMLNNRIQKTHAKTIKYSFMKPILYSVCFSSHDLDSSSRCVIGSCSAAVLSEQHLKWEVFKSNQIIFFGLRSSKGYYKRPGGSVGLWEGSFGCEFLRGSMCAEGMGCGRRWA